MIYFKENLFEYKIHLVHLAEKRKCLELLCVPSLEMIPFYFFILLVCASVP